MKMKKIMKLGAICLTAVMVLAGCGKSTGTNVEAKGEAEKTYKIGVTQIVEHPALDAAREGFVEGLKEAGFDSNVEFVNENAQGEMATAQIIAQSFVESDVDMIYAIATPTAQAAFNATKEIPIMISAVTDPVAAGLTKSLEKPETNVSGTSDEAPVDLQLQLLGELGIKPQTIGFIYNTSEKNSEVQLEVLKKETDKLGWKVEALGITSLTEIEQGIDVLLDKVDVLYAPTDNMVASAIQLVASKAIAKKIPVLAGEPGMVEGGALATCGVDYFALGKQTGFMAAKVLKGEDISVMSVEKAENPEITINKATADALGIVISETLSQKSNIIGVK
jgi:putative ABC transport system substrate-binding protein